MERPGRCDICRGRPWSNNGGEWLSRRGETDKDLTPTQKQDLELVLRQFGRTLSQKPGKTNLVQHQINVKGEKAIRLPPRRWPKHLEGDLIKEIQGMRDLGVIELSNSEWRSYPVTVPKPDGKVRVCIDFRKVNIGI